jgi:opacity protein-like surface antigen
MVAGPIAAQLSPGVQGGWATASDFSLGARVVVGLHGLAKGLETSGIFDYYFPSEGAAANVADWEASANLVYRVGIEGSLTPYAGAGVGVVRYTATVRALETDLEGSETRTGLNLLGGLLFEVGRSRPFLEARVTLGGSEQFALSAGVRF